uniref:Uncharacterized protein n=1 Tax=viral metagenome TaxID=1070528 RepID=A0A6C0E5R5_9ZZZZ
MGNTFSEMGNIFHKKSDDYHVVNVTSNVTSNVSNNIIEDPLLIPDKVEPLSKNEIETLVTNKINTALIPIKKEFNTFYTFVDDQSQVNLKDHIQLHNIIYQLQQEISGLRKEIKLISQYQNYDLEQPDVFPEQHTNVNVNIEQTEKILSPSPSVQEFIAIEKKLNNEHNDVIQEVL